MNRKQKIEFLKGLKNGTRSISELANDHRTGVEVFIQKTENTFIGHNGKSFTKEEISKLAGWNVIIANPHLKT